MVHIFDYNNNDEIKDIVINDGIYICPECGSHMITETEQAVIFKISLVNNKEHKYYDSDNKVMTQKKKALQYDMATSDGIGCITYGCLTCGWVGETKSC